MINNVRNFVLKNATGQERDLTRPGYLLWQPSGLGWGVETEVITVGNSYTVVDEQIKRPNPSGTMVFAGYAEYDDFLKFVQIGGLKLGYKPTNTDPWRWLDCSIQIEKSEIDHTNNRLLCPITFNGLSQWYETATLYRQVNAVSADDSKVYVKRGDPTTHEEQTYTLQEGNSTLTITGSGDPETSTYANINISGYGVDDATTTYLVQTDFSNVGFIYLADASFKMGYPTPAQGGDDYTHVITLSLLDENKQIIKAGNVPFVVTGGQPTVYLGNSQLQAVTTALQQTKYIQIVMPTAADWHDASFRIEIAPFSGSARWQPTQKQLEQTITVIDEYKGNGYIYDYKYSQAETNQIYIQNGSLPSYWLLRLWGAATNPEWRLYQNGEMIKSGRIIATIPTGHYIEINAIPAKFSIIEYDNNGQFIADRYGDSDWTTERFFEIPAGESFIQLTDAADGIPDALLEVYRRV